MSTKRMLADVLWEAANVHLRSPEGDGHWGPSCCAVAVAAGVEWGDVSLHEVARHSPVFRFLAELGCTTRTQAYCDWEEAEIEPQGIRYMWLLLAMHVAEDEGIEL
jgi:hypothetical protein